MSAGSRARPLYFAGRRDEAPQETGSVTGEDVAMKETIRQFLLRNRAAHAIQEFGDNDSLLLNGLIDSGTMVEMILFLESEFGISVEDSDVTPENMDSLSDLVAFVAGKQRAQQTATVC